MIYQIKVQRKDAKPPLWRRIRIPREASFESLHQIIACTFAAETSDDYIFYYNDKVMGAELLISNKLELEGMAGNPFYHLIEYLGEFVAIGEFLDNELKKFKYLSGKEEFVVIFERADVEEVGTTGQAHCITVRPICSKTELNEIEQRVSKVKLDLIPPHRQVAGKDYKAERKEIIEERQRYDMIRKCMSDGSIPYQYPT